MYLNLCGDIPIYNIDIGNNPFGAGMGIVFLINGKTKFKPKLDLNFNWFINRHIVYFAPTYKTIIDKRITSILIGPSYSSGKRFEISLVAGTCFYYSRIFLGLKPGVGLYLDKNQKYITEVSLTNLIATSSAREHSFGFLNLGFRIKLY